METKSVFLAFISSGHSEGYWSDVGVEEAIGYADELTVGSWNHICQHWQDHDPIAQDRLAYVAGETCHLTDVSLDMLLAMLSSSSRELVETSIDSLNSISQSSTDQIDLPRTLAKLRTVQSDSNFTQSLLSALLKRLEDAVVQD